MDETIRVLVVEDDPVVRRNLCAFLDDEGFSVLSSENGEAALGIIRGAPPDLAIVDIRLPGLDGEMLIVRAHALAPAMQFLIHTGSRTYRPSPEILAVGVTPGDIFQKPLSDMSEIARAIRRKIRS
jgi:DNA-binding NtrC family response regulator